MLTEDEAKKRWCPHARALERVTTDTEENVPVSANRACDSDAPDIGQPLLSCMCIGSACMAWRWGEAQRETRVVYLDSEQAKGYKRVDGHTASIDGERWHYEHTDIDEFGRFDLLSRTRSDASKVGYCGLAGRPEL